MNDLITKKQSKKYPELYVLKYKRKVFYDNLWNDDLMECRGHVVDNSGNIVIKPFTKIFNYGENGTTIDRGELCLKIDKINGFMGCLTYVEKYNKVIASTTGSLDSEYCEMIEDYVTDDIIKIVKLYSDYTFMFEVCHPNDPHIIKENYGLHLIGMRNISDDSKYFTSFKKEQWLDELSEYMNVLRPSWEINRFSDIVLESKTIKHEGFLVYGLDSGTVLKIKSPHYKILKFLARISIEKLVDKLGNMVEFRKTIDEEFYDLIDYLTENIASFRILDEQLKLEYIKAFLGK